MTKYRIKPIEYEAIQYKRHNLDEIIKFCGKKNICPIERRPDYILRIKTYEGERPVFVNQYVIKDNKNKISIMDDFILEQNFDKLENDI